MMVPSPAALQYVGVQGRTVLIACLDLLYAGNQREMLGTSKSDEGFLVSGPSPPLFSSLIFQAPRRGATTVR